MARIGLAGPTYLSQSYLADNERTVNWFPEVIESQRGPASVVLYPTPGTRSQATSGSPVTGMIEAQGKLIAAFSSVTTGIASVNNYNSALNNIGGWAIPGDGKKVYFAASPTQLLMVSAGTGSVATIGVLSAYESIYDHGFPADVVPIMCDYSDGYFVILGDDGRFYISGLNDALSWNSLDSTTQSATADLPIALAIHRREIWLFGSKSTQVFWDSGAASFPFQAVESGTISHGIAAIHSHCSIDNSIFWLASNEHGKAEVMKSDGYNPKKISTYPIDNLIQAYTDVSDAVGWSYQMSGHNFYVLNFPTANHTWVYDDSTNQWHEWLMWNLNNGQFDAHVGICHAVAFGNHYIGSRVDGFAKISMSYCSDNALSGGTQAYAYTHRLRQCAPMSNDDQKTFYRSLRLKADVAQIPTDATDLSRLSASWPNGPDIILQTSNDGGVRFGNERKKKMGKIGETRKVMKWKRLGYAINRVYRLTANAPVPYRLIEAYSGAELGFNDDEA